MLHLCRQFWTLTKIKIWNRTKKKYGTGQKKNLEQDKKKTGTRPKKTGTGQRKTGTGQRKDLKQDFKKKIQSLLIQGQDIIPNNYFCYITIVIKYTLYKIQRVHLILQINIDPSTCKLIQIKKLGISKDFILNFPSN